MKEISILAEKSATYMHSATVLVAEKDYNSAVSRAYYAMFYLTQAVLSTKDIHVSTHTGVNNKFSLHFVKNGIFPKEFGRYLSYAAQLRSSGDYEVFNRIDKDVAEDLIRTATIFNLDLKNYLQENGFLDA